MVAGLAHKKYLKKQQIVEKKMYKQKTANILTKYGLPIKSDLISRGKQYRSNNTEIDSPPNHVLTIMIIIVIMIIVILIVINSYTHI